MGCSERAGLGQKPNYHCDSSTEEHLSRMNGTLDLALVF